jgi:DNA methylase
VLDLCCGAGDQALALERRGARVAAANFCVPMLAIARRKGRRPARRPSSPRTPSPSPSPKAASAARRLPSACATSAISTQHSANSRRRCISTRPGEIVLDPFGGGGSTFQEAQRLGRYWIGSELGGCGAIESRFRACAPATIGRQPPAEVVAVLASFLTDRVARYRQGAAGR